LRKISVHYLGVPFAQHFEQPASIAQRVNRILLIRRFNGILKPIGDARICQNLFESHTSSYLNGNTTICSWSLGDRNGISRMSFETEGGWGLSEIDPVAGVSVFLFLKRENGGIFI
jgi:hypothetical protein